MTPKQEQRLKEIRCLLFDALFSRLGAAWTTSHVFDLLYMADELREDLARERVRCCPDHDAMTKADTCRRMTKEVVDALTERDALRARVSELETCGYGRIIIQTPTPLAPSDALDELRARVSELEGALTHAAVDLADVGLIGLAETYRDIATPGGITLHKGEDKP
jgi:hypothetical protein